MEPLAIVVVAAVTFFAYKMLAARQRAQREDQRRKAADRAEAERLALAANAELKKVKEAKTTATKEKALTRALEHLREVQFCEAGPQVVENLDGEIRRLHAAISVIAIVDKVEKADRHRFKGSKKAEMNALADALYEIETEGLTSDTFLEAGVAVSGTGEVPTVESIRERLEQLGWERPATS
jgi:NCAIR mutase (PurE)-related protein